MLKSVLAVFGPIIVTWIFERWSNTLESLISHYIPFVGAIDLIFIIVLVVVGGLWYVKQYKPNSSSKDKKKHTQTLVDVYRRIAHVGLRSNEGKLHFAYPKGSDFDRRSGSLDLDMLFNRIQNDGYAIKKYFSLYKDQFEYLDHAMEHLKHKKYKNIETHWNNSEKLLEEYNNMTKFEEVLEQKIVANMKSKYPDFIDNHTGSKSNNWYDLHAIKECLIDTIHYNHRDNTIYKFDFLITDRIGHDMWGIMKRGHAIIAQIASNDQEKINLENYRKLLLEISQDNDVLTSFQDTDKKHQELDTEMKLFRNELSKLVTGLKDVQLIEGTCSICR